MDDEQSVLDGLRRALNRMRDDWDMTFVVSPQEAMELVQTQNFAVVVADMRMPQISGAEVLERVRDVSPTTVRLILTGHSDVKSVMKAVGPGHQLLAKPCTRESLEEAIRRAVAIRSLIANPTLTQILGKLAGLPTLPAIYQELVRALREDASMEQIGAIISRDLALTTKLLRLANSGYFGISRTVGDATRAAMLLGSDAISGLVLGLKVFEQFPPNVLPGVTTEDLTRDASWTVAATRQLCLLERVDDVFAAQTFIAAFLHDVGLLTLAGCAPDLMHQIGQVMQEKNASLPEAEQQVLGVSHGAVGGYLAALWGFPDPVVEAIVHHHRPSDSGVNALTPLALLHVAQTLSPSHELADRTIDEAYLAEIHVLERLPDWLETLRRELDTVRC